MEIVRAIDGEDAEEESDSDFADATVAEFYRRRGIKESAEEANNAED